MFKVPHQVYTAEFKEAAVQRVKDGQGVSAVARELGMSTQTLRNWLKASEAGKLNGPGAKVVTAEQMELSRLRAEHVRDYLLEQGGFKPDRFKVIGYGQTQPIGDNATRDGRALNRRVEVIILKTGAEKP